MELVGRKLNGLMLSFATENKELWLMWRCGDKSDWAPVVSGVPQGTVLGPLLFSLHINDITSDIESEIRLFADDCVCYREIKNVEDTVKLQKDIDRLVVGPGMRFQPVKCSMMQLTGY